MDGATKGLARPFRVLNLDAREGPIAMKNEVGRWCMTAQEAGDFARYCTKRGYHVEVVRAEER